MTNARKIEICGFVLCVVFALLFARGWVAEYQARIGAEAASSAKAEVIRAREDDVRARDLNAATYAAAMGSQAAAVKTPAQAVTVIERYLPVPAVAPGVPIAPAAVIATVNRSQLSAELQKSLPPAPSFSLFTPAEVEDVARHDLACDATGHELMACQADAVDLRAEVRAEVQTAEVWKTAAKGGTKWHRLLRVVKLAGCGAAGAEVGSLMNRPGAAAIGATAGVVGCSAF